MIITISAKPQPIEIDIAKTAVIVVDMQNDFGSKGGTTSICVDSTIRDAMYRDYHPILLADCTTEPIGYGLQRNNHEASLLTIQVLLGCVSSCNEFVNALPGA